MGGRAARRDMGVLDKVGIKVFEIVRCLVERRGGKTKPATG